MTKFDINTIAKNWNSFEEGFIVNSSEDTYSLRLKSILFDEKYFTKNLTQHGNLLLLGFYGQRKTRERLLGYIIAYVGSPIIHAYTWYISFSYSDPKDIRSRPMKVLYSDKDIRFQRAGIGVIVDGIETFDYLLCYRAKRKEHDIIGYSDGSVALDTASSWKDGL